MYVGMLYACMYMCRVFKDTEQLGGFYADEFIDQDSDAIDPLQVSKYCAELFWDQPEPGNVVLSHITYATAQVCLLFRMSFIAAMSGSILVKAPESMQSPAQIPIADAIACSLPKSAAMSDSELAMCWEEVNATLNRRRRPTELAPHCCSVSNDVGLYALVLQFVDTNGMSLTLDANLAVEVVTIGQELDKFPQDNSLDVLGFGTSSIAQLRIPVEEVVMLGFLTYPDGCPVESFGVMARDGNGNPLLEENIEGVDGTFRIRY